MERLISFLNKSFRRISWLLMFLFTITVFNARLQLNNHVLCNIELLTETLCFSNIVHAAELQDQEVNLLLNSNITISYKEQSIDIVLNDLIPIFEPNANININKETSSLEIIKSLFSNTKEKLYSVKINKDFYQKFIEEKFNYQSSALIEAHYILGDRGKLKLIEDSNKVELNYEDFIQQLNNSLPGLIQGEKPILKASLIIDYPEITVEDLNSAKIKSKLITNYTFYADKKVWKFKPSKYIHEIEFYKNHEGSVLFKIPEDIYFSFLEKAKPILENDVQDVYLDLIDDHPRFNGIPILGHRIDNKLFYDLFNNAFNFEINETEIPITVIEPKTIFSDHLIKMGIKEIVGKAHTTFHRSPYNRIHNINHGVKKFNGIFLHPGEEFSFNKHLGIVEEETGYRKELVIKEEGTIPEFGGGVCQISSTIYRAALLSGLPITRRYPHSFAVEYYAQVMGHGLDATVYPPWVDLKFKNDFDTPIIIQAWADNNSISFVFYGGKDGREIILDGPRIYGFVDAPEEVMEIKTTEIPEGETKDVGYAHRGFSVDWKRTVHYVDEPPQHELIKTKYLAVPAKRWIGISEDEGFTLD